MTSIGKEAFEYCSSLTSVTLPEGVTSIGDSAFRGCKKLADAEGFVIVKGILFDYTGPGGNVVVPEGVTSIGYSAFWKCSSLTSVTLPEGVTSIGNGAFCGCSSLTSITLPEGVTSIGCEAFRGCSSLTSVTLPAGVTSIGGGAFYDCSSLTSITLPAGVTSIGGGAFYDCSSLTSITLPEGVTSIGDGAFLGCKKLADAEGFVIVKGILFDYTGPGGNVVVPEGVTSIGYRAFYGCSSLTSVTLPEGVTNIGDSAFWNCSSLTSISLPEGVTSIGDCAFYYCSSLTNITLPEGIRTVGSGAFSGCHRIVITVPDTAANRPENFDIQNGILKNYKGPGGGVIVPEGVTSIGGGAFKGCSSLTSVTLPDSVTSIGDEAFRGCSNLTSVTLPEGETSIGNSAFSQCSSLQYIFMNERQLSQHCFSGLNTAVIIRNDDRARYFAYSSKSESDNLRDFVNAGNWTGYDLELINNGPAYKYRLPARLLGALGRLLDPVDLTAENRALYIELLNKNAKKLVPVAEQLRFPKLLSDLFALGVLDAKTDKAVRKLLSASALPELAALAEPATPTDAAAVKRPAAEQTKQLPAEKDPLQEKYAEKFRAVKGEAAIRRIKLVGISMPKVLLKDGSEAPEELFRFLLASYGSQLGGDYHFVPEADEAAALLRYDSLCEAMDAVSGHLDGPNYPAVLPLLCRFGNAQQLRALTDAWKAWGDWNTYNRRGRTAQETLEAALILSDTRETVVWLEKHGGLNKYAALRGVTVNEVYERFLFDFGFDESGKRTFDLGAAKLEATLTPELTLALFDTGKKKAVRSVPKKDVDPALWKKTTDELSDMRRNLKKAAGVKNGQLFEDYLEGTEYNAAQWKQSYLRNPFLRAVARLLVWAQGNKTFILTDAGPADSAGAAYTITDSPICIAHPMEMTAPDVTAWQHYFTSHGLKQPFQQVWEPVFCAEDIRPDRYSGCRINPLYLKNQQRRGIDAEWYETEYYESKHVDIRGFEVAAHDAEMRPDDEREYVELKQVKPIQWNRRTNMVISYLDRITVWDRVKKDDVSVIRQMERFTLAQITEMVGLAQEASATNVLAALLDYKNAHFSDFDPMDEFTLEW